MLVRMIEFDEKWSGPWIADHLPPPNVGDGMIVYRLTDAPHARLKHTKSIANTRHLLSPHAPLPDLSCQLLTRPGT